MRNIVVNTMESVKKLSLPDCTCTLVTGVLVVGWLVTMTGFEAFFGEKSNNVYAHFSCHSIYLIQY